MKEFFQNSKRTRPRIELPEKGGRKMSKPIAKAKFYAMTVTLLFGELTLKNIICRLRPCNVFTDFPMLIARPTSYSFPSGHTSSSFAAALILTLRHKKVGWLAYIPAVLIAFSRIFLFVHYPTDVLAGILLGTLAALLTYFAAKAIQKRQAEKRTAQI